MEKRRIGPLEKGERTCKKGEGSWGGGYFTRREEKGESKPLRIKPMPLPKIKGGGG